MAINGKGGDGKKGGYSMAGSPEFKIIFGDREPTPEEFIEALSTEIPEEGKRPLQ